MAGLPQGLMYSIQVDQDISCRIMGRCTYGTTLDREILDLASASSGGRRDDYRRAIQRSAYPAFKRFSKRSFLYARYNADLSRRGLDDLGFGNLDPASIQKMDAVENMSALTEIGRQQPSLSMRRISVPSSSRAYATDLVC